jgi:predicted house-cleaning noncanonical NTP pyrophosphatase (MazG superfamily)
MTYDTRLNRRIAEIIHDNEMAGDHANPAHFFYNTRTPMHKGVIPGNAPYDQMQVFGGVNRLHKANRWSKFVRDLVPESVRNAVEDKAVSMIGRVGGVNRLKKAKRYSNFVRDLVPKRVRDALEDKAVGMIGRVGGVNRLKKANKWSKFVRDLVPESVRNAVEDKAVGMIGRMGGRRVGSTTSPVGGKRPSAWIEHVKAYQRAHGCSYKEAMMGAKASYKK